MNYKFSIKELHIPVTKNKKIELRDLDIEVTDVSLPELADFMKQIPELIIDLKRVISYDFGGQSDHQNNVNMDTADATAAEKEPKGNITSEDPSSESQESDDSRYEEDKDRDYRVASAIGKLFNLDSEQVITCEDPEYDLYEITDLENSIKSNPTFVVIDEFDPEYNRYVTSSQGFYIYANNKDSYDWAALLIGETAAARDYPCLDHETLYEVISHVEPGDRVLVVPKYGPHYVAKVKEKHREFYNNSTPNELLLSFQYYLNPPKDQELLTQKDQVTVKVRELDFLVPLENVLPPS